MAALEEKEEKKVWQREILEKEGPYSEKAVKQLFMKYDADKSGSIDIAELEVALSEWRGYAVSSTTCSTLIQQFDGNNDGVLQYDEFVHMARKLHSFHLGIVPTSGMFHVSFGDGSLGLQLKCLDDKTGFMVLEVNGVASDIQLEAGDVLCELNGIKIQTIVSSSDSPQDALSTFSQELSMTARPLILSFQKGVYKQQLIDARNVANGMPVSFVDALENNKVLEWGQMEATGHPIDRVAGQDELRAREAMFGASSTAKKEVQTESASFFSGMCGCE